MEGNDDKSHTFSSLTSEKREFIKNSQNYLLNDVHNQKLPISFIAPKDWQKYLHFTNVIKKSNENVVINQKGKNGRILRLFQSFHKLYLEYSKICAKQQMNVKSSGDTAKMLLLSSADLSVNSKLEFSKKEEKVDKEVQTVLTMKKVKRKELLFNISNDFNFEMVKDNFSKKVKNIFNPSKCVSEKIKVVKPSHKSDFLRKSMYFDKIVKMENNIEIKVEEESIRKSVKIHKFCPTFHDTIDVKISKEKMIQIPLAFELLLPKMQKKVEVILNRCPFLCDPLEVVSELRQFEYDQKKCIEYFENTKGFRCIIDGITSNDVSNDQEQVRSKVSSAMSINSHIAPNMEETNQNSNIKECINFSLFSEKSNFLNGNNSSNTKQFGTMNSLTQTSKVHFYMDDKNMESFFYKIKQYISMIKELCTETRDEVEYLQKQLCCVFSSLKSHISLLINHSSNQLIFDEQKSKMMTLAQQVEELKMKLKKEEKMRRNVYNLMHEQMGNIRVYCRSRNIVNGGNILEFIGNEIVTSPIVSNEMFEFDKVFQPNMSQEDIYEEFSPLVMSFIDGYNVCFITYGGEASGKTFTLVGGNDEYNQQGLMQRALTTILTEEKLRHRDWEYKITACVVEIYNDNCIDVLSGETNIQLYVDNGMETAYHKLKSVPITNEADVEALMQVCRIKRKVAKTALNPASSRSHLITLIRLQGRSRIHGENICSFLCLCDLAGFEDIIKAETQTSKILSKEAGYINRSLTAFNRVFVSLRKQDPNTVSYRDTKLTHLLKPFLTNSGKCALIVTVRNDKRSIGSTQNTLRFGRETRGVTLGKARRQINLNSQISVL